MTRAPQHLPVGRGLIETEERRAKSEIELELETETETENRFPLVRITYTWKIDGCSSKRMVVVFPCFRPAFSLPSLAVGFLCIRHCVIQNDNTHIAHTRSNQTN